jgi:hypothetical protein
VVESDITKLTARTVVESDITKLAELIGSPV